MVYACQPVTVTLPVDANGNVIQTGGGIQCTDQDGLTSSPVTTPFVGPLVTPSNGLNLAITNPLTLADGVTPNEDNILVSPCDDFSCYREVCPGETLNIPVATTEAIYVDAPQGMSFLYTVSSTLRTGVSLSK